MLGPWQWGWFEGIDTGKLGELGHLGHGARGADVHGADADRGWGASLCVGGSEGLDELHGCVDSGP